MVRLTSSDLLQEQNFSTRKVRILPEGQAENRRKFLIKTAGSKLLSTAMSGLVAGFGIVIGNWVLGAVFAGTILASAIGAIISGADYATNTLKNRFIGKGDLLIEFNNIKDTFIFKEEKKPVQQTKPIGYAMPVKNVTDLTSVQTLPNAPFTHTETHQSIGSTTTLINHLGNIQNT